MPKYLNALIILFLGILIITVWGLFPSPMRDREIAPRDPSIPEGWFMVYDPYGYFSIAHPKEMEPHSAEEPYYYLPTVHVSRSLSNASYRPPNYSQEARFIISSSTDTDSCFEPVNGSAFTESITFRETTFRLARLSDAGLGHRYETVLYRALHRDRCFGIAATLHTSSDWTDLDLQAVEQSQQEMWRTLEDVIATFQFE